MLDFSNTYSIWWKQFQRYSIIGVILLIYCVSGCGGDKEQQLNIFTWAEYVSEEIRTGFEDEFGVKVVVDIFASNEDLLAKLHAGATGYDIIMPSDYMVSIMAKEDMLAELERDNIPNFKNISADFLGKYFDPENKHSVPYTFGTAGIAYDSSVVSPDPDSWQVLWDEKYKKQFSMLDDGREVIGATLKLLGYSFNSTDPDQLQQAKEKLIEQKPLLKRYDSETQDILISKEVALAHSWSGDAIRAAEQLPTIRYVIPKEGSSQFIDNVCIPKTTQNKLLAEKFINYLLRPEVNAKITEFTKYGTCVPAAKEHLPENLQKHEYIYPSADRMETLEWIIDPGEFMQEYSRAWEEIKAK